MTAMIRTAETDVQDPTVHLYPADRPGVRPFAEVALGSGARLVFEDPADADELADTVAEAARQLRLEIRRQASTRAAAEQNSHPYPSDKHYCGALDADADSEDQVFMCTLELGHEGDHEAWDWTATPNEKLASWPQAAQAAAEQQLPAGSDVR